MFFSQHAVYFTLSLTVTITDNLAWRSFFCWCEQRWYSYSCHADYRCCFLHKNTVFFHTHQWL